jgi:hypothetical protein
LLANKNEKGGGFLCAAIQLFQKRESPLMGEPEGKEISFFAF